MSENDIADVKSTGLAKPMQYLCGRQIRRTLTEPEILVFMLDVQEKGDLTSNTRYPPEKLICEKILNWKQKQQCPLKKKKFQKYRWAQEQNPGKTSTFRTIAPLNPFWNNAKCKQAR